MADAAQARHIAALEEALRQNQDELRRERERSTLAQKKCELARLIRSHKWVASIQQPAAHR
jgi:hypothetical protein